MKEGDIIDGEVLTKSTGARLLDVQQIRKDTLSVWTMVAPFNSKISADQGLQNSLRYDIHRY